MPHDPTEFIRREMLESGQPTRDAAGAAQLLDTEQLSEQYTVLAFLAPFVVVRRKRDGAAGTLEFVHSPRRYFNWQPDNPENDR